MRVLCSCLPGTGHFLPMLPLGQALVEAGHEVAFATAADYCPSIEKLGFATFGSSYAGERSAYTTLGTAGATLTLPSTPFPMSP